MTHPAIRLSITVALTALLVAPGCKKAQDAAVETAIERATGAKVEKDGDTMTIKTEQGEVKVATAEDGGTVAMPADFPKDVYLPADNKLASAMDMAGMQMLNMTTPQELARVSADIEKSMQGQGWKREMAMQAGDGSTLMYSKDNRQVVYQMLKADEGGTQLAVRTGTNS
ncbi:hypothetical protein [Thermomonas carbonis]|uniref:Uncharacterized protein n=1 Tax=Thermomonas carbonis TaxID=1463158 RepID=A0A7G9SST2_9GAMM|nr:hypothetical protein [Thermomonas carbonis]QNN70907.1 hypothetical protein H9L16_04810 [Thermomonas carbonis]GHC03270.1 hypothetical protein GCM10010080_16640 [Thermomonas carbonis]